MTLLIVLIVEVKYKMKHILISVVGPTAIGKTALAIKLANYFKTEIISADSRQFYKEMYIGTAVPSEEELNSAKHHFIQHKSIFDHYSVGDFEKEALEKLKHLFANHKIIVMVGGSGLYVNAVTKGLDTFPKINTEIRESLNKDFQEKGIENLQLQLKQLDPDYFSKVDTLNPHRLIRALEICIGTNKPYSSFLKKDKKKRPFYTITVGIDAEREIIYDRINKRVDIMMNQGLLTEAKDLYKHKALNALQTVGYRELFSHFDEECTLEFAISEIKKNTRRFAKRQLTWFKKNEETLWVDYNYNEIELFDLINEQIKKASNIN